MKLVSAFVLGVMIAAPVQAAEAVRRLSADQYRNIIHDVFGASIELGGKLAPDLRLEGLSAIGAARVSITAQDMEQYDAMARSIAAQVVNEKNRRQMVGCAPAAVKQHVRMINSDSGQIIFDQSMLK